MTRLETLVESLLVRWPYTAGLAFALVLLALLLHRLGAATLSRLVRGHALAARVEAEGRRPMMLVLPLLLLQLLWHAADDALRAIGPVRHVNALLLIAALTWLGLRLLRGAAGAVVDMNPLGSDVHARSVHTQTRVLARIVSGLIVVAGLGAMIMTFPGASQLGASLLASAGVAGLLVGLAARPAISNLIAGLQIAITQPIRLDDVLIIQGEWGRVEEITGTYVVFKVWDERRLVIPLQWFIENPFQNWTRHSSELTGTVFLWVDHGMPLAPLRAEAQRICEQAAEWDRRQCVLHVFDVTDRAMQLRWQVTARNADHLWELRCKVREGLVDFMQREYPQHLPRQRVELTGDAAR